MRTLSTDTAAAALGVEKKVLDNILAREARSLIAKGSRGRSRRISIDLLERIALAMVLQRDLGTSIETGLDLAARILESPSNSTGIGSLGALTFDAPRLRKALELSVDEALESVPERPRGRPKS
jgi:hypothetical protein